MVFFLLINVKNQALYISVLKLTYFIAYNKIPHSLCILNVLTEGVVLKRNLYFDST